MKSNKARPTSQDVAKAAGVSQSTVSMVLNGKSLPSFTDDTIRRVQEAAERLGYKGARGDRQGASGSTVLVFCPVLSNPYYPSVVQAVEEVAYKNGYRTSICTTYRSAEIEMHHLSKIDSSEVAGIVFTNIPLHIKTVEEINRRIPVVVIGDREDMISVDTVEVSSYRSGEAVAGHLMELGHRSIAFVSTSLNKQNTIRIKRLEGVRDVLEQAGADCRLVVKDRAVTSMADMSSPGIEHQVGYELAKECLADRELTAIIGVNDMVAYGVMDALLEAGHRIPDDYSVCGFDNIFPSRMQRLSLTSLENFMTEKGQNAMESLLSRIKQRSGQNEGQPESITRVEYQPRLIIRNSTGPARGRRK